MNKLSKEKQQQVIAVVVGAVVVVACMGWFLIGAQLKAQGETKKSISEAEDRIASAKKTISEEKTVKEQLETVKTKLDGLEQGMATGDLYSWMIDTVNKFNINLGKPVDIPSYSRDERVPVGMFPEFPYDAARYTLRGSGYYHQVGKFIAAFENAFPYMRIQNVEITPNADVFQATGPEREKLTFRIEIVALIKPDPEVEKKKKADAEAKAKANAKKK